MKLSQFQFELPKARLAQRPAADRDESRLMVLNRKEEKLEHYTFKDIINFFEEGDVTTLDSSTNITGLNSVGMTSLSLGGVAVTSTAAELNILDGVTATTTEINHLDGVTGNIQTQIDANTTLANTKASKAFAIAQAVALG